MASPIRTLTVNFVGRTDSLDKAFKRVSKGSSLMSDRMRRSAMIGMGAFAGIGAAVVAATAVLKPMIDKAASMEEAVSKNRLMFGEASKAVERFAETSLHGFGVTEGAALQATGVFGSLGRAMGMADADSADMAITLTKLAGDLSSLHDVDVETALTALRAGLIGEAEPLRKLGILLDAATIKTKALEMGLVDSTKDALTPAIKSQAAYALILQEGEVAMGDFERTIDSATNQSKIFAGEWVQISTEIGEKLLPAFTSIVTFMNDELLPAFKDFVDDPSVKNFGEFVGEAIGAVFPGARLAIKADQITPLDIFGALIDYEMWGVRLITNLVTGVETGLEAADIRARLGAIFADVTEDFAFDLEAVLAQETPLGGEFVVEGWQEVASAISDAAAAEVQGFVVNPELVSGSTVLPPQVDRGPGSQEDLVDADRGDTMDDLIQEWLNSPDAAKFLGFGMDPGQRAAPVNVTIIAPAVTGQEVWDAMGKAVQENGPMPPHWQMSAT